MLFDMLKLVFKFGLALSMTAIVPWSSARAESVLRLDIEALSLQLPDNANHAMSLALSGISLQAAELAHGTLASRSAPPRVRSRGGVITTAVLAGAGTGLAVAGIIHVARADERGARCEMAEQIKRERELRRAGWAITGVGSAIALSMLSGWAVFRFGKHVKPWRPAPAIFTATATGTALAASLFLWAGMVVRSVPCYE